MNFRSVFANPPNNPEDVTGYTFAFQLGEYLAKRGDSRVYDWQTLNANAKYFNDVRRAAMKNWENKEIDIRTNAITYTMKRRDTLRMAMTKVLRQNDHRHVRQSGEPDAARQDRRRERGRGGGGVAASVTAPCSAFPRCSCRRVSPTAIYDAKFVLSAMARVRRRGEHDPDEARRHRPAVQRRLLGGDRARRRTC